MHSPVGMRGARVRAPELAGRGGWIGTGGRELRLADLRGRFVLLDFWTSGCVNCLHVLDELRPLEERFADVLVVLGVHSPKFAHEADHDALVAAVQRYEVDHPVLDDPDLTTWQAYTVKAWPTLTLVDPEGYVVAQYSGEGHAHALAAMLTELVAVHDARGTLHRSDGPYVAPDPAPSALRFPGKVLGLPDGTWLVSDTGHHSLVVLDGDAGTVLRRIGDGTRGLVDGGPDRARFSEPQGLCLLPPEVAAEVGHDVVVADTVNHALRGLRSTTGDVVTLAGTGAPWMQGSGTRELSSPWDLAWWQDRVWIAMAGIHQLWTYDPRTGTVEVAAGTTNEGLVDGPARSAWFAQTSGLSADGVRLWLADPETSALRVIEDGAVRTVVGTGLFDFGLRDGPADDALLQHPLGVTALPNGSVAVCDTYNDALRRYDPAVGTLTTMATGLREPSGAAVDGAHLLVVESAAHRLTRVPLGAAVTAVATTARRTQRPVTEVGAGAVELVVRFAPPPGEHLDERYGPATRLHVTATPPALLADGSGRGTTLVRTLTTAAAVGDGVLHVAAMAASCDDAEAGGGVCHVHQQDWGVPVRVVEGGPARLELVLGAAWE